VKNSPLYVCIETHEFMSKWAVTPGLSRRKCRSLNRSHGFRSEFGEQAPRDGRRAKTDLMV
jgi:hypothetical protein